MKNTYFFIVLMIVSSQEIVSMENEKAPVLVGRNSIGGTSTMSHVHALSRVTSCHLPRKAQSEVATLALEEGEATVVRKFGQLSNSASKILPTTPEAERKKLQQKEDIRNLHKQLCDTVRPVRSRRNTISELSTPVIDATKSVEIEDKSQENTDTPIPNPN